MILSSKGASLRSALLRPDDDECRTECREVTKPPIKARHDAGKDRRWRVKDGATHILDREFGKSKRYTLPLSFIILDIDHFKKINDSLGHLQGDRVLAALADLLKKNLRAHDVVARYGGEEFAAILPETDRDSAAQKAEMLRQAVEEATVAVRKAIGPVGVTISVGVASWPDDGTTIQDVLDAADRRLYNAKQKGRNRVSGAIARIA